MKEITFLKQNTDKWKSFETFIKNKKKADPDQLAELFIQLTDDFSYAKTFYPDSKITAYLNTLTAKFHQAIYRNKKEDKSRFKTFWKYEQPVLLKRYRKEMLYSLIIFIISFLIGVISSANDDGFVRLILGDTYVKMTMENIEKGDPMAVYKSQGPVEMFFMITINNIRIALTVFVAGILFSFGTGFFLFYNGVMLGSFQYFFYKKGFLLPSILSIWIHGTLEISAIIIAGGTGLILGNSLLFPGTYTRTRSFVYGAKNGLKILIGIIPLFLIAGFLESFVTRHTEMPMLLSISIITVSLTFIVWYYIIYPMVFNKDLILK